MKNHHWSAFCLLLATFFLNHNLVFSQEATDDFNYSVAPDSNSSENYTVGTTEGKFDVTEIGAASYSMPIKVMAGLSGLQPEIAINYNSNSRNGMLGWGFSLSGISAITRGPKTIFHDGKAGGVSFTHDDAFYLDGKRLLLLEHIEGADTAVYCLEDDEHSRIVMHGLSQASGNEWFTVNLNNGKLYEYGKTGGKQSYLDIDDYNWQKTITWYLTRIEDAMGNFMLYEYLYDDFTFYPQYIRYGNNSKANNTNLVVNFEYEERTNDVMPIMVDGVVGKMRFRLKEISTGIRKYKIEYNDISDQSGSKFSRITKVTEFNQNGEAMKPTVFNWNYIPTYTINTEEIKYDTIVGYSPDNANIYMTVGEFNGDGKTDIIERFRYQSTSGYYNYLFINTAYKNSDGSIGFVRNYYTSLPNDNYTNEWINHVNVPIATDCDGDGISEIIIPQRIKNSSSDYVEFKMIANNTTYSGERFNLYGQDYLYNVADFNNDGRSEILVVRKNGSGSDAAAIIGAYTPDSTYKTNLNLSVGSDIIDLHLADMNRDGLVDIITFTSDYSFTYFNDGSWFDNSGNSILINKGDTIPSSTETILSGDFNGDQIVDFILCSSDNTKINLADGKGNGKYKLTDLLTTTDNSGFALQPTEYANYHVLDFDGDGKLDLVANKYRTHEKTTTYWFRSTGTKLEFVKKATSQKHDDYLGNLFVVGDFNGDGLSELINKGYDCYNSVNASANDSPKWRIYLNNNDNIKSGKIASITNGAGATTNITYNTFTDRNFYTQNNYGLSYPIVDYCLPLKAVSSVTRTGGATSNQTIDYTYSGIRLHLQGRGFLGMKMHKASNSALGTAFARYKLDWSNSTYLPSKIEEYTINGNDEIKRELFYNNGFSNGVISYQISRTRTTDFENQTSTSHYLYDEIDGRLSEEMHVNSDLHTTVNYYRDYVYKGNQYLPTTIEHGKYYEGYDELFTQTTVTEYDDRGLKTSVVENSTSNLPLTTTYTYDIYGNVKSKSQTGSGISISTEYYDYDATNRFIARKYTTSYPRIKISYSYDIYDNLISVTDSSRTSCPQTTLYSYDNWGNKVSETSPTGQRKTFTRGWGSSMAQRYYVLEQGTAMPWKKTWYDVQGREVKQESVGANDVLLAKTISYDNNGQVSQIANTVGDITTTDYFTYDTRGRVLSEYSNTGKSKTYSYSGNTVTSTIDGKSYSATYDSWGNVIETSGPDGTMSYMYHSCGKPISITSNGSTVTMEYDDCGNQTKLTDPDAGIMTYAYDALGRVTTERDASGNTTTYSYNKFGKISSVKVNNNYQTSYSYSVLGNNTGLLASITCNSGRTYKINYTYDAYNRVTKEVHNIPNSSLLGTSITYNYTYNTDGLLETMTYPGNVTVRYSYDSYGNKIGTSLNGQNVWALEATDGYETTVNRGQNLTSTERLDMNGNLVYSDIAYNGSILHQMAYTHNANTGNVLSRTGMFTSKENFTYDDADRLTGVSGGMSAEYRYAPNGNITFMTGMGNFAYESSKPHAVTGLENTTGQIDKSTLYTTYNSIGKISTIHDPESGFRMNFSYGPDNARCDVSLYNGFDTIQHITYIPGCDIVSEKDQDGEYFHQWYYYIGDGVLYYRDSYGNTDTYYTYTDNIGSITRIYDGNGDLQFSAKYDPWGKQTNVTNNIGLIRGYTGHEHIWPFGLINMNGRLYDPLIGRFLSTDNFVQEPLNAQNFNRYSYCLNNPLKYNDPSGELWWFVAAAAAGGIFNVANNWDKIDDFGSFLGYFGVGATAGAGGAYIGAAAAAGVGVSGILGGIISGGVGGLTTGFVEGSGNTWLQGGDMIDIFENGLYSGLSYGVTGAVTGGVVGGVTSYVKGENIWNGAPKTVDIHLTEIEGIPTYNERNVTLEHEFIEQTIKDFPANQTGTNSVYLGFDDAGNVRYVGITKNNPEIRFQQHRNSNTIRSTLKFKTIPNTGYLTRQQARIIEQKLINLYGLPKLDGMLYNKINSIAPVYWQKYGIENTYYPKIIIKF